MRAFATRHARALVAAVAGAGALLLVALGAATLGPDEGYGWRGSAGSSTSSTSSTTSSSSTTTTTEPTTTTTPPPPRPTTSVAPPPARPAPPPTSAEPEKPAPPTTEPASSEPCAKALVGVRAVGLPEGWNFYCSAAKTQGHAGLAGWNYNGESFIAVNPGTGDHPGVGAHEACHAHDFVNKGATSEASADACAEAHGYPNPYAGLDDVRVGEEPAERAARWLELALLAAALVLIAGLLSLLPSVRRLIRRHTHRKD